MHSTTCILSKEYVKFMYTIHVILAVQEQHIVQDSLFNYGIIGNLRRWLAHGPFNILHTHIIYIYKD